MQENNKRILESNLVHRILSFLNDNSAKKNIEFDISEYILTHIDVVQNMGIEELAEACYTSSATISRYIKKIGYRNFINFKSEVEGYNNFRNQNVTLKPMTNAMLMDELLNENIKLLENLKNNFDLAQLEEVANKLKTANKVYFFGIDYSQIVAQNAQLKFVNNEILSYTFVQQTKIKETIQQIKSNDVVFYISASGQTQALCELDLEIPEDITRVLLTENPKSMLARKTDELIVLPKSDKEFAICATTETIGELVIIDMLYLLIRNSL